MGFYGHIIKDPGQTQFYFDRTYSNLAELKNHETSDGIYSGRYVLVEYTQDFKYKGSKVEGSGSNIVITKIDSDNSYTKADGIVIGDFVYVSSKKTIYKCTNFNGDIATFTKLYTDNTGKENIYDLNFNVDKVSFSDIGRGYDSTVWQKVFTDDDIVVEKYVMIAELNSVTPTFNVYTNPPTEISKGVYFEGDTSTNLTYNMYVPNAWDFTADTPQYNKDGFNPVKTIKDNRADTFKVETKNDTTKNLVIDIPSVGNIMADVLDNVYGKSESGNNRPLYPVNWVDGMNDTTKIYRKDGKLWRYVSEQNGLVELPLDNSTGSLKALQLQMHQWLGTNESRITANENTTIPGAVRKAKEDVANLLGYANDGQGFNTVHGAIDTLTNTNLTINREWTGLKGSNSAPNKDTETIYGALNVVNTAIENANSATAVANTAATAANTAKQNADTATANARSATTAAQNATNAATTLLGAKNDGKKFETMYGAIEELQITHQDVINLMGDDVDTNKNISTVHGALNVIEAWQSEALSADDIAPTDNRQYLTKSQKNQLFNDNGKLFATTQELDNRVNAITASSIGLGSVNNTSDDQKPVSAAQREAINSSLSEAKKYTDNEIALILNNTDATINSITELAKAIADNDDAITQLNNIASSKAAAEDLTNHTNNKNNPHGVTKAQLELGNVENKSSATIRSELTGANVISALGYTPPQENTTYGAGTGISLSADNKFSNSGVLSVSTGGSKGTISVKIGEKSTDVPVKDLGTAAYQNTDYFATSGHKHAASDITSGTLAVARGGTGATTAAEARNNLGIYSGTELPLTLADGEIFFLIKNN